MEDGFKKNPSSSVNDENESENHRNSNQMGAKPQQQSKQSSSKNFMAPTISAASKSKTLSPRNKILVEWNEVSADVHDQKSSNLGSKSISHKVGISNFGSRKALPKIPTSSSTDVVLEPDGNGDEEDTFVPESFSSDKPYDPLTNYLSPRPKFLRYNPNRRRGIILGGEGKSESSISPRVSVDSQGYSVYSTADSSLIKDNRGSGHSEDQVVVEEEEDVEEEEEEMIEERINGQGEEQRVVKEEEEEEVFEERKWGCEWKLFKSLLVFAVLVLSSMYVSSMNSNLPSPPSNRRALLFEYPNSTSGVVSSRSSEFGNWLFNGREETEMCLLEISGIGVEHEGKSKEDDLMGYNEAQEVEISEKMQPLKHSEDGSEPISESVEDKQVEDKATIIAQGPKMETDEENVVLDSISKDEPVENEAKMVALDVDQMTHKENWVDFIYKMADYESKSKAMQLAYEAEILAEVSYEGIEEENVDDHVKGNVDSELKSKDRQSENDDEVSYERVEEENADDHVKGIVDYEPKFKDGQSENEPEVVASDKIDSKVVVENEHNQFSQTPKNMAVLVISSMMTLVASFLIRFYFKCKKASSKTIPSKVKMCLHPETAENNSLKVKLPPKVGEKLEPTQNDDSYLNPLPVTPPREERLENTPRIIPKVKVLSEFAVEGDLRSSLNRCVMLSKMQENKESEHFFPQERRMLRTKESQSGIASLHLQPSTKADSRSYGSSISQEKSTNENGKEEAMAKATPTPLRRSSRLRNRGVTSP